jgi:hypothetical protein
VRRERALLFPTEPRRSLAEENQSGAIFALNFFLGWTLAGWVVALVWALTVEQPPPPYYGAPQ